MIMGTSTITMTTGKFNGMLALANGRGVIAAMAMDQRGSLRCSLEKATGRAIAAAELQSFKALVTDILSSHASAVLLDPEYGLEAIACRPTGAGELLTYEQSGYDNCSRAHADLMPTWSVRRLVTAGAQGIKIVMYYDPDDADSINTAKYAFIERIGAECQANDVAFFLEPVTYSDTLSDTGSLAFAKAKPEKVTRAMAEFSRPQYGVDILKVEIPVNMRYVVGSSANPDGQIANRRMEAISAFQAAAAGARVLFIYLSAGVSDATFRESLELAAEAKTPYSGVLCGRATWQDGIAAYAQGGEPALRAWLGDRGIANIAALNTVLDAGAQAHPLLILWLKYSLLAQCAQIRLMRRIEANVLHTIVITRDHLVIPNSP